MRIDVALGTNELIDTSLVGKVVVVLDVLRATTTIAAALAAGVREIQVFADIASAREAAQGQAGAILCGEVNCLAPEGFELGNSPGALCEKHRGKVMFMSTTNGTRAILAARGARALLTGALVNAGAVAKKLRQIGDDATLLCAGTDGDVAIEDVIGAGAIICECRDRIGVELASDAGLMAERAFEQARGDLVEALRVGRGGQNVIRAGLADDIVFAARLNCLEAVGIVKTDPLRVVQSL